MSFAVAAATTGSEAHFSVLESAISNSKSLDGRSTAVEFDPHLVDVPDRTE